MAFAIVILPSFLNQSNFARVFGLELLELPDFLGFPPQTIFKISFTNKKRMLIITAATNIIKVHTSS